MSLPNLLAIDASNILCSVAIQSGSGADKPQMIYSATIENSKQQAVLLLPELHNLLVASNLELQDIDAFVLSSGPGRFTGLRIATSCIQGLAYITGKKVITVNSLQLLAQQYLTESNMIDKIFWICQKAYNQVLYNAKYIHCSKTDLMINADNTSMAVSFTHLIEQIKTSDFSNIVCLGDGWLQVKQVFSENKISIVDLLPEAKYMFDLANREFFNNNMVEPEAALPIYAVNPYA
ncbi:MAG: tRNA (adenosine(37)-N6)-threonylcarbamoyltransferase complex dimerization subunit type 1 TsaB [Gammaproteobacteria bacterium]|nr:tRNA (adenosine(37)-N6)-threonylcarbamoyltransferase complex dimerization subunit type 1 TsaB [Gammaproteobacteria bacterium]